ncbi:hypothetical protein SAMN05421831_101426 [Allopseudospirillum japonicum]|uniref:Uncharacterized protein n=1 Tax=Allopseudospirillum japonicum TaxID=64971 RepID=A0A1H6QRX0_9GAMM|nr:hypothetical protein [Allopseudospirillum japonicum]SEI41995.1 hypothetical protein SAMN05421831_101426 [Allopseudospirillum japonicum]
MCATQETLTLMGEEMQHQQAMLDAWYPEDTLMSAEETHRQDDTETQ